MTATTPHAAAPYATAPDADSAVAHLAPRPWERANRRLVRKALAEFAHERLITPQRLDSLGAYAVTCDDPAVTYRFTARRRALDHGVIDAGGIVRHDARGGDGPDDGVDAQRLILDLRDALGLSPDVLPVYLEEIASTLSALAYRLAGPRPSAAELAGAPFQAVEAAMTEGHPCFVANSGRLGFDADEYHAYAPEAAAPVRLVWLAARREVATFTCAADLDYAALVEGELDAATLRRFAATLAGAGLRLGDVRLIPVHPWQWRNRLAVTFAGEIARRRLVYLGPGEDAYQAQQSIRTFFNTSAPRRHYVKTALSVLNMGFVRGLSAEYMRATPAINDWLAGLVADDPVLSGAGMTVLRERAAVGYHPAPYEEATEKGSPYRKMLAALWRESPVPGLADGERLMTMAALLHTDDDGGSLAAALIDRSGLAPAGWLRRYLDAYLTPLLHCFFAHDLVFMPHGENVILVLDDAGAPVRAIFKDIGEEIAVLGPDTPLPADVERVRATVPDELKPLSILTDVIDCVFRFLSATLDEAGTMPEAEFWATVAERIRSYQAAHPELATRFARYDLFAGEFPLSCLNRLQLRDNHEMVDLTDPTTALSLAGPLTNPLTTH